MIIVKLMGGLGNQMFQYAAGRRLAHVHDTELKLDLSWFETQSKRRYELGAFNLPEALATTSEVDTLSMDTPRRLGRLLGRKARRSMSRITEQRSGFNRGVLSLPDDVYLEGYWQSEQYFADISDIIRREFSLKAPLRGRNAELAESICSAASVSVHVRRGDYVRDPETAAVHGTCSREYYDRAAALARERAGRAEGLRAFVFSDEPQWVHENLDLSFPMSVVEHNGSSPHEDLRLMSLCRYHIIANSSFSWWGAWLAAHPDKHVVAPSRWFRTKEVDAAALLPADWKKV